MGLFGVMRTGVSGMNAQSSKLGAVSDNIANSSTTGYKQADIAFSSLVLSQGNGTYNSGGVEANTTYSISEQGSFSYTTSTLDLAIDGDGFFVVSNGDGASYLTRAGSFVPDAEGYLVNTAGYYLQGYPITDDTTDISVVANGLGGLEDININQNQLEATATTEGTLWANVPEDSTLIAAGSLPSDNVAGSTYTSKTSLVVYDNLGNEVTLDVYYSKTADGPPAEWEITVYDAADADATSGGFPYSSAALSTDTFLFDATTGDLTAASPTSLSFTIPDGAAFELDMSGMTALAADFTITSVDADGNAPSAVESVEFDDEGVLWAIYENGERKALYKIALADVASPDNLTPLSGNVYQVSTDSGEIRAGFAGEGGFGTLQVGALEDSTVDLATELTKMIEAQRTYSANSKSFQAGSSLLEELVNMVR